MFHESMINSNNIIALSVEYFEIFKDILDPVRLVIIKKLNEIYGLHLLRCFIIYIGDQARQVEGCICLTNTKRVDAVVLF